MSIDIGELMEAAGAVSLLIIAAAIASVLFSLAYYIAWR
jgi:hypothetical protein